MIEYLLFTIGALVPVISLLVFVGVWRRKRGTDKSDVLIALCHLGEGLALFWFIVAMILIWA